MLNIDVIVYGRRGTIGTESNLHSLQNNGVHYHFEELRGSGADIRRHITELGFGADVSVLTEVVGNVPKELLPTQVWSGFCPDLNRKLGELMEVTTS